MSQECQQPQAHPARCGCEQKKPYPDRLCHIDYTAHPYRCGCLKGDAEAQRRFDEHQHQAPVPPAGGQVECAICADLGDQCVTCEEAEFAAWADRHFASADYRQTSAGVFIQDWMRHSFAAWQARGKDVTRLQAENSALQQRLTIADQRVDDLQADLTAARELLKHGSSPTPAHCESVLDFLAGQSAPAPAPNEEEWHMNQCQQGHRDVGACGGKAFCHTCDETITAATTQEAFEQWNATHPTTPQ